MFFRSYSDLLSKFGEISFQEYVTEGIPHPVIYGDLVYKLRGSDVKLILSRPALFKRLRRRKYDTLIIERTIGLVLGPSTALYWPFLKHCTLTNKAVETLWRDLSKPPQRRQGPDPCPLWLLVGTHLALGPELASRRAEHSPLWLMPLYILRYCFYHLTCLCNNFYGLSALVGCWSSAYIRRIIHKFWNVCPFDYTTFAVSGKVGTPQTVLTTPVGYRYPNWPS